MSKLSWCTLLVSILALPLFLAPSLAELLGWRLDSVVSRLMMVGGLLVILAWHGVSRGQVQAAFEGRAQRSFGLALGITVGVCCLYTAVLVLSECESLRPEVFAPLRIPAGLITGVLVSAVEEPVFRRWLPRHLDLGRRQLVGAILASFLYSLIHYIRPTKVPAADSYSIGDSLAIYEGMGLNLLKPFLDPAPGIGLFLLGLLLCAVARRGGLPWTIGIHAGVVFYIKADSSLLYWNHVGRHWLFGSAENKYDGVLFWIVCACLLGLVLALPSRPKTSN